MQPQITSLPAAMPSPTQPQSRQRLWYYGWNVLAVAFVYQAVIFGLIYYCFTFWIAIWMDDFAVQRSNVLLIMLAMSLLNGICAPFAGRALDRFSIRVLVVVGILCFASGLVLVAMADSLLMIGLIYSTLMVIGGLWAGPFSAQLLAARWFFAKRGMAIGVAAAGTSFGGFVLPPLVTWLIAHHGWRETHLILAAVITVVLVPLVFFVVRNQPQDRDLAIRPEGDAKQPEAPRRAIDLRRWSTLSVLKQRSFWITVAGLLPVIIIFGSFGQNLAPLASDLGIATQKTALLVSTMALCMVCGKVFFGAAGDVLDHKWLIVIAQMIAITALGLLVTITPSYTLLFLISGLVGFASGGILPLIGIVLSTRFGAASFGLVAGLLNTALILGAFGPWLAGFVRDQSGSYTMFWLLAMGFAALTLPLVLMLPKPPEADLTATEAAAAQAAA